MKFFGNSALKPALIAGYTTRKHLLLDFDNTNRHKVTKIIFMIFKEWPEVGDALLVKTNNQESRLDLKYNNYHMPYHKLKAFGYHVVFDNLIGYNKCCKIIETLAELRILNKDYSKIRRFRGDMTLRITPKVLKYEYTDYPHPIIYWSNPYNKREDNYIFNYLFAVQCALDLCLPKLETERITDDSTKHSDNSAKTRTVYPLIDRI